MSDAECGFWATFSAIGGPVVLSTPTVWSSFRYFSMWEDTRNPSALAEEYLRRPGNLSLSIEFRYSPDDVPPQHLEDTLSNVEDASKDEFDALLTRSPQWKAAKFEIPASIHLKCGPDDCSFHDTEIFRSCPRLVDLTLELSPIPELFTQCIDFPWHQLTRYSGTASYGPQHRKLRPTLPDPHLGSRLIHRMRSLRLRYGALGFDSSSDFLDDVELSALERLALSCDSTGPVASLLHRSPPPLESLEFRSQDPRRSASRLVDVLTAAPALTRLVIWNGARDDMHADASEVFHSLIHSPGLPVPSLLPRLKYLELSGFELDASFVRMVESRYVRGRAVSGISVPESDGDPLESLSVTILLFSFNSDAQTRPFIRISNA
ncbi:hypothetical protein B0H14DRAFT_3488184 [Mycena olivaceomarginata]|nr:hypothetical protein B0H14DRAFT_3488184 [Mycena olivaceomarginata]